MPASEQSNSSLLIGVAVSALTHVGALYALRHIEVGVGGSHVSTASFAPLAPLAAQQQPPVPQDSVRPPPPPPVPAEQPPPKDLDREIRFGDDRSTIESMTWLGTDEPTTPSGKRGELDQAALSPEPGEEGTPGSPFVAIAPSPSPPSPGATAASQPGAPAPSTPLPSPPTSEPLPKPLPEPEEPKAAARPEKPTDPTRPSDPAAEELKKPKDAPLPAPSEKVLPKPGSEDVPGQPDPLSESAGQSGKDGPKEPADQKVDQKPDQPADAERKGEKVAPSDHDGTAKSPKDAGKSPDSEAGKPGGTEGKGAEEATPEQRKANDEKPADEKPADEKPADATPEQPTPNVPNPGAPAEQPSGPTGPKAAGSPTEGQGDGGQNKLNGRVSEQESEAFTSKPIVNPMRDATVQAGKGLKIITRRAVFTNTTLVTQQPRDTLVRVRFQRDGTVKKAEFVEGGSTGNPNIDEPILNAVHRWRASGKDLERLSAKDTLSVVIRITFR